MASKQDLDSGYNNQVQDGRQADSDFAACGIRTMKMRSLTGFSFRCLNVRNHFLLYISYFFFKFCFFRVLLLFIRCGAGVDLESIFFFKQSKKGAQSPLKSAKIQV